jgi:hypothetical protein
MGWTTSLHWNSRQAIIAERIKPWDYYDDKRDRTVTGRTLAYCVRGNCLWKVVENTCYAGKTLDWITRQTSFIALDLIQNYGKDEGWGYKDMDESVGPNYYSCPLKYLALQPHVDCQDWRKRVQAYHAKRDLVLYPGLIVGLSGCTPNLVKIEQTGRRILATAQDGRLFRIKRSLLNGNTYTLWPDVSSTDAAPC